MHRDLKLENIIISTTKNSTVLKIIDFGLATKIKSKDYIFLKCGTPGFVAPEVFQTDEKMYNEKCDIFSAGIISYIL